MCVCGVCVCVCVCACVCVCVCVCVLDGDGRNVFASKALVVVVSIDGSVSDQLQCVSEKFP